MKKIIFSLIAFTACLSAESIRIPEEFTVTERLFSPISTFDVATDLAPVAVARKRLLSLTPSFDLEDALARPIATARARFFAWGTVADVNGPSGEKIGWIE